MDRIKISSSFYLDEYLPKDIYLKYIKKKPHYLSWMIDERLVDSDQKLRDKFGPITINNWLTGGDRNWSGLRTPGSKYYSQLSSHSTGRASDKIFKDVSSEEVRNYIRKTWEYLGINAIEDNVNWVHTDIRYIIGQTELYIFNK